MKTSIFLFDTSSRQASYQKFYFYLVLKSNSILCSFLVLFTVGLLSS